MAVMTKGFRLLEGARRPETMLAEPVRELRHRLGLSQTEFWGRVGLSQAGGSRYELADAMPVIVESLVRLVYIEKIDISRIRKTDWQVIRYLKEEKPDLLVRLKQAIKRPIPELPPLDRYSRQGGR